MEDSAGGETSGHETSLLETFPSLEQTLDELRTRYEDEDRRREGVDVKASVLLAGAGVVLSIMAQLAASLTERARLDLGSPESWLLVFAVSFSIAVAAITLWTIRRTAYRRVGGEYLDFYQYARLSPDTFADHFALEYIAALRENARITSRRQDWLVVASIIFVGALVLLAALVALFLTGGPSQ